MKDSIKPEKGTNMKSNYSGRRDFIKKASAGSLGIGLIGNTALAGPGNDGPAEKRSPGSGIKITDLRCAIMGNSPVVRITTDAGISGYGQAETSKPYLKPHVLFYKDYIVGEDPTNVERIMLKIRRMGSFKPWGSAVSAIEIALWDVAGKAAGLPVYKLLGGKIRDQVRCYNGGVRVERKGNRPEDFAEWARKIRELEQGFSIVKTAIAFHGGMADVPGLYLGNTSPSASPKNAPHPYRGTITEYGLKYMIDRVAAIKEGLGENIGLALDCGPGFMLSDAIRLANALEPFNLMWMEDMLTGDYTPYILADDYRELTKSTITPIHTGEQLYLRENFRDLIDKQAVRVVGPDPEDVGGIAELKWIAEYANFHGIQMAPHGVFDGLIGLAAHVQVGAAMPENFIAFEYPVARPEWWYDIVTGLPDPIVSKGLINVWDKPGLGVDIDTKAARKYLAEEDSGFFD
jgi:L-alanine-DL-glutamate epimerase-like enolase superfamily enzyme